MRKFWLLLIIGVFLIYNVVNYPLFFLRRAEIKHEMKELMLATNQFDTLSFSLPAFRSIHWIKKGKEFIREGKMYDVVSLTWANDSIIQIAVVEDIEETNLHQWLRNHTENASSNSLTLKLKLLLNANFILQNRIFPIFIPEEEITFVLLSITLSETFEEVLSPPPRYFI